MDGTATSDIIIPLTYAGTATSGADYTAGPTSVTILAGQSSATVTLHTLNDSIVEGKENVFVNLGTPNNSAVTVATPQGVGDITDTTQLHVSIGDAGTVNEGQDLAYTVTMDGTATSDIIIPLTYAGTATSGADYTAGPSS